MRFGRLLACLLMLSLLSAVAADKPARDPRTLRVMTYNIHIARGMDDKIDLQRMAVAAVGAVVLTTAFVGAAVAPASVPVSGCVQVSYASFSQFSDLANA